MKFRTEIEPLRHQGEINPQSRILLLGSCFSQNVGQRLRQEGFQVAINPFGQLYNPASIAAFLQRVATCSLYTPEELIYSEESGLYHCLDAHTSLSKADQGAMVKGLNSVLEASIEFLSSATHLIITLGTAWVYRLASTGQIVANCHKLHPSTFSHELMSIAQARGHLHTAVTHALSVCPNLHIIFTVSPIRHLADGLHGNNISKSTLLLAIQEYITPTENDISSKPPSSLIYFPAYEALIDDLRDYRFYASDMKHPSEVAIEYIYQLFKQSFMDRNTIDHCALQYRQFLRDNHRPLTAL
ncbi:MAG: GSCFA domain-containing protein [Bacteroidales bacterium]|nr:GSCFA domain-containing protein [Bacteroidales bacterium]